MTNCEVKEGKYSSDLEVVVRSSSELTPSPRKFDIPTKLFSTSEDTCPVTVGELTSIANFARVSVKVKVLAEQEPVRCASRTDWGLVCGTITCPVNQGERV